MTEDVQTRWTSRKFWSMAALELISTGLLTAGLIEAGHWVTVTLSLAGAYFTANVAQRIVER